MKTKFLSLFLLFTIMSFGQNTLADKLKILNNTKNNSATRVLVQDSVTKEVNWILKSSISGSTNKKTIGSVDAINGVKASLQYDINIVNKDGGSEVKLPTITEVGKEVLFLASNYAGTVRVYVNDAEDVKLSGGINGVSGSQQNLQINANEAYRFIYRTNDYWYYEKIIDIPNNYYQLVSERSTDGALSSNSNFKYPTEQAVKTYVDSRVTPAYTTTVFFNAASPVGATIFDDENPPVENDPSLVVKTDNLYIGTDGSTWVYSTSPAGYFTKEVPNTSNFDLQFSGGVDATNNKNLPIERSGSIYVTGGATINSSNAFNVVKNGSDTALLGGRFNIYNAASTSGNMFQLNASNGLDLWNYASGTWNKRFTFSSGGNFTASTYNGYTPANDNAVVHLTGNETIAGVKSFSPSISASTNLARGTIINPSLTATANNDVLVGLDIAPSFTNGVFTGVKNYGIRSVSGLFTGTLSTPLTIERTNSSNINIEYKNNTSSVYAGVCNALAFGIGSSTDLTTSSNLKVFTVTGNTVLQKGGSSTDDGVNRLQVTGTVSSGTTTLGNTPPTANNQLTRKDYVDTKAPTASPTFTGTPTAPTAAAGTNTAQIATTAFVRENVGANTYWTKTGGNIFANNSGNVLFDVDGFGTGYKFDTKSIQGTWINGSFTIGSIGVTNGTDGVAMYINSLQAFIYGGVNRDMNVGTLKTDGVINASINNINKTITSNSRFESLVPIKLKNYTVATLPAGTQGDTAYVTDALAPTYLVTVVGGGAVVTPVFYDGVSWKCH